MAKINAKKPLLEQLMQLQQEKSNLKLPPIASKETLHKQKITQLDKESSELLTGSSPQQVGRQISLESINPAVRIEQIIEEIKEAKEAKNGYTRHLSKG